MSDDNIVDFGKALHQSKSDNAASPEERTLNCMEKDDCECMYCNYRNTASTMVIEFIKMDMYTFANNTGAAFTTFDLKDIFFKAIHEVKREEKDMGGDE